MESIDRQILALLAADGRMSYTDLGKATGLSTSAAQHRVRRLEQRGIITGYRAEIAPEAIGRNITAFISLRPMDPTSDDQFAGLLETMPEVVSCHSIAGESSHIILVQVSDPPSLDALLTRIRHEIKASTITTVVLTTHFSGRVHLDPEDCQTA